MFFPIGDDQVKGGSFPLFSYGFIVLNVIVFFMQLSSESNLMEYASVPSEIVGGNNFHTVITSMFLHGGWMHLLWNMLFLWIFADNIEATIGNFNFLLFYLLGGVAATLAHIYFNSQSSIPMVGASGAISAVLGAYIVMFPRSRVKTFFLFFFINIPAFVFLGIWICSTNGKWDFICWRAECGRWRSCLVGSYWRVFLWCDRRVLFEKRLS